MVLIQYPIYTNTKATRSLDQYVEASNMDSDWPAGRVLYMRGGLEVCAFILQILSVMS